MKILVTGGAGFIGSHLVEALVKRGDRVTVIDNLSSGNLQNLKNVRKRITFHKLDIGKNRVTSSLTEDNLVDFDVVYHLAAKPWSKEGKLTSKEMTFYTNVVGTYNVLSGLNSYGLVVFTSSANVYGNGRKLREETPISISSMYGYTKIIAETVVLFSGFRHVIFRPGTVIGSRGRCFPNRLVWCAVNDVPVEIFNNGNTWRDIIDVRDVVSALLITEKLPYGIYNLGSNSEVCGRDLVELVAKIGEERGHKLKYRFVDWIPKSYVPESTLVTKLEGSELWKPKYSLEESIETLFNYYESGGIEPPSWESL